MAFSVPELPEIKQTMVNRGHHVGKEGSMFPGGQFDFIRCGSRCGLSPPGSLPLVSRHTPWTEFLGKQRFARGHGVASLLFNSLRATLSSSFSTFFLHFTFADCLKSANDQKT